MASQSDIYERLRKVEALFASAGTDGGAAATAPAIERLKAQNDQSPKRNEEPTIELQFSLPDAWAVRLFFAVCRKHGITPYRCSRHSYTTVVVRVQRTHFVNVVDAEFQLLYREMMDYLHETAEHLICDLLKSDGNEYD